MSHCFDYSNKRVVITGAGSPARWTPRFQEAGLTVGHVVPSPRLARKACDAGVDFLVAESSEAGGHVRAGGLATLSLVPQVVDAVSVPVVAAGGIADGRGVVAALAMGASGVQMGTRFVATQECEAHPAFKGCVVRADAEEAVLYGPTRQLSRGLTTPPVRRMLDLAAEGASQERLAEERGRDRTVLAVHLGVAHVDLVLVREGELLASVHHAITAPEDAVYRSVHLLHALELDSNTPLQLSGLVKPAGPVHRAFQRHFDKVDLHYGRFIPAIGPVTGLHRQQFLPLIQLIRCA